MCYIYSIAIACMGEIYKLLPCEQSQFSSPTRKIDSAVFVFFFVQEFGRSNRFKPVFDVRGSFYTVNPLLTDD